MRVTMQQIVFNAASILPEGMLRACVLSMYPFVDEIRICEGATKAKADHYWDGDTASMTKDGRSTDATLDILFSIPDPANKIQITRSRGWWNGKTEMMNDCNKRSTGDYVWQVDADEFYHERDIPKVLKWLDELKPHQVDFYANHFWGGYNDICDDCQRQWGNDIPWRRIFRRLGPLCQWRRHEPPEYELGDGRTTSSGNIISREDTKRNGVRLFHYGFAWRKQAEFKQAFYRNPFYLKAWDEWQKNKRSPIINGSHTVPFRGDHPSAIKPLIAK